MSDPGSSAPLKKRRITRACDRCHQASVKCTPSGDGYNCRACAAFGSICTYNRPLKRRGPPPKTGKHAQPRHLITPMVPDTTWVYSEVASHQTIMQLANVFYHVCYPIFPFFHWPTFTSDLRLKRYTTDRSFFILTMAVCANAAARIHKGCISAPAVTLSEDCDTRSEIFYQSCLDSLSRARPPVDFDSMRTHALLGLLAMQYDDLRGSHHHLHQYLSMSAEMGFHNETRWDANLNCIEKEERRRLFWQQYQFDVYLAVTFGSVVRHREAHFNVRYPTEVVEDEDIHPDRIDLGRRLPSFLSGWNFVVDLYRILEHLNDRVRGGSTTQEDPRDVVGAMFSSPAPAPDTAHVLETVQAMYDRLGKEFKGASSAEMTGNPKVDRFAYQAANIVISMTTVKMVLAGTEERSVPQRCAIAGELLDSLASIPASYIKSSSTAMLHHLAGVGHLLASVIQAPLSQWKYLQVRAVLVAMADLISTLEAGYTSPTEISDRVRRQIQRIDQYMQGTGPGQEFTEVGKGAQDEASAPSLPWAAPTITDGVENAPDAGVEAWSNDLLRDWPFDLLQGDAFDFLAPSTTDPVLGGDAQNPLFNLLP